MLKVYNNAFEISKLFTYKTCKHLKPYEICLKLKGNVAHVYFKL